MMIDIFFERIGRWKDKKENETSSSIASSIDDVQPTNASKAAQEQTFMHEYQLYIQQMCLCIRFVYNAGNNMNNC